MNDFDEEPSRRSHLFPDGDSPDGGRLLLYFVLIVLISILVLALIS